MALQLAALVYRFFTKPTARLFTAVKNFISPRKVLDYLVKRDAYLRDKWGRFVSEKLLHEWPYIKKPIIDVWSGDLIYFSHRTKIDESVLNIVPDEDTFYSMRLVIRRDDGTLGEAWCNQEYGKAWDYMWENRQIYGAVSDVIGYKISGEPARARVILKEYFDYRREKPR